MKQPDQQLTQLLVRWSQGDQNALEQLLPLIYEECRRLAARQLRREREDHTLNATALVHELYFKLVDQRSVTWQNRAQFFALAAQLMRRILVDYARARNTRKRGGSAIVLTMSPDIAQADDPAAGDILAIDEALQRLAAIDSEQVRIIELRFFAGLTVEETAHVLGRSPRTIKREWQLAKAWLYRELQTNNTNE